MQRIESTGTDNLTGRIMIETQTLAQNNVNELELKIINSFYVFIQFLGKLMIPYLIIFVPIGIILFFKEKNIQKLLLIIPGLFLILPSLYAYTIPALDSRYLFPILPILCIIGVFSFKIYFENRKYKKIIITIIIIIVVASSFLFLNYKNINVEKEQEFIELAKIINKNTDIVLYVNSPVLSYLDTAKLSELKEFPVISSNYNNIHKLVVLDFDVKDLFLDMKKHGITHMIIDEEINNPIILKKISDNLEKYKNLHQIFDSKEAGYNYHIKIYKINYN
tara:strand:- start:72 stop:905 length:834 start_codon:yes stop_codon:yes gene_type:complete